MILKFNNMILLIILFIYGAVDAKTLAELEEEIESIDDKLALSILENYEVDIKSWNKEDLGRFYTIKGLRIEATDVDLSEKYYSKSIGILEQLDFISEHLINALIERSYINYLKTNSPEVYCKDRIKALKLARETNDYPKTLARAMVQYSFCFDGKQDQFQQALLLLEEAINIAQEQSLPSDFLSMIYNATAILYRTNGIYDKAYEYFQKAYQGWEQKNDIQDMFNMQHSLVNISISMDNMTQAKRHVQILYKLTEENESFEDFLFFSRFNMGMIAFHQKKFPQAIEEFEKMLDLRNTTNEQYFVKIGLAKLAIANFRLNKIDAAQSYAKEVLALDKDINSLKSLKFIMLSIIDYSNSNDWLAIKNMWQYVDSVENISRKFIKNSSKAQSLLFDSNLQEIENKISEQKIAINNLRLMSEKRKNKIANLTIVSIVIIGFVILLFTLYLWRSKKKLIYISRTDFLTKISNRRYIFEAGQKLIDKTIKKDQNISLFIFDIDDFKKVNDIYGHDVGDKILKQVAEVCQSQLPENCIFGRFGGEEFIYMIANLSTKVINKIANEVREKIAQSSINDGGRLITVTISTGVSTSRKLMEMDVLLKKADQALYQAKNSGKNNVILAE